MPIEFIQTQQPTGKFSPNYFGAHYLDPMLGMWFSVDPKRQFASPYLYAGNGYNPVNVVDPDGNLDIITTKFGKRNEIIVTGRLHLTDKYPYVYFIDPNGKLKKFAAPPQNSYFHTENIIGQKFDPDMEQNVRIHIKDAYEKGPFAFLEWGEYKGLDFKNVFYLGADKTIGTLHGTIMTARDVGNAIWGGWTRYSYLNNVNLFPEPISGWINFEIMDIISNAYSCFFQKGKVEDLSSAVMQKWGFENYQP